MEGPVAIAWTMWFVITDCALLATMLGMSLSLHFFWSSLVYSSSSDAIIEKPKILNPRNVSGCGAEMRVEMRLRSNLKSPAGH